MSFHGMTEICGSWLNDRGFLKMVAGIDMFLHWFKDNESAILRMGSLESRFRDCAGLLSYGYAQSILNIDAGDLMDWIFVKSMGDELVKMSTEGQESGNKESYFPDLGLVSKSAYSSNANPYLFLWIHIIGCILWVTGDHKMPDSPLRETMPTLDSTPSQFHGCLHEEES